MTSERVSDEDVQRAMDEMTSETELFRTMRDLLEGIAQIAENHGFKRGDDLQVWLSKALRRRPLYASSPEPVEVTEGYSDADEIDRLREALKHLVRSLDDLTSESEGVYGLHLNGDPAPWGSLVEGGQFEQWLIELERARAALKREGE